MLAWMAVVVAAVFVITLEVIARLALAGEDTLARQLAIDAVPVELGILACLVAATVVQHQEGQP